MDISLIISIIVGFVIISLIVSGIIQKREQIAAEKRQKAAQFVYRARNAQETLHNLRGIPTNPEISIFILGYITKNYQAAASLAPKLPNLLQELNRAKMHQQGFIGKPPEAIEPPADEHSLKVTIAKLKRFSHYLKKLNHSSVLNNELYTNWSTDLQTTAQQYEISGLFKLASRAVSAMMPGTANTYIETLQTKLETYPLDENYRNEQLASLTQLKSSLKDAVQQKKVEEEKVKEDETINLGNKQSLFGERKKW